MGSWFAAVAVVPLLASSAAVAQSGLAHPLPAETAASETDFKLPTIPEFASQSPLQDGMLADDEIGSNARVGLGLVPMSGRNIHSVMIEQELVPTRNPGVSLVVKLGR